MSDTFSQADEAIMGAAHQPRVTDREHNMLQHQIDALFVAARTVTHQISDLTIRWQRMDSDIVSNNRQLDTLAKSVTEHINANDARAEKLDNRIDGLMANQSEILKVVTDSAAVVKGVRDAQTTGRVLAGALKSLSAVFIAIGVIVGGGALVIRWAASDTPYLSR